jgi:prepilin-type N-terminal cleavage/methylation domain-containing protein
MPKKRQGFTLLELLLAVVVVVFALFPLLGALSSVVRTSTGTETSIIALNLAQEKLEENLYRPYAAVTAETTAALTTFPAFRRGVAVTTPSPNLKKVSVSVYWTTQQGKQDQVTLETYALNI